jgi:hypothetical protein
LKDHPSHAIFDAKYGATPLENDMNAKFKIMLVAGAAILLAACSSGSQSLILGKWQAESAVKLTAEFNKDGTASITMFGQTLRGTYKLNGEDELEWTMGGKTTKAKIKVTETDLELTDASNRTIIYRRKGNG